LYSVSTAGEVISLRQELYKLKMSREDGIASWFMRISEIRDQLQDLGEVMSDREMTTIVLNALPEEWGNFISSICGKKEATPFQDLWSLCKIEESRLKAKFDVGVGEKNQAYATMTKRKGKFGKFGPPKKKKNMAKIQCYGCQELGTIEEIVLSSIRTIRKEEEKKTTSLRKWRKLKGRSRRRRK